MLRIYARKTDIKIVDIEIAQDFVEKYHRQRSATPNTAINSIGLFYNDELIAVSQFCSPRTSLKKRTYTTELLRMCFKDNIQVIGGASKMVKYYKTKFSPADIFTYQETTGINTNVYEHAGFKLVSQSKKKQYLVKTEKSLEKASKHESLSIAYAAKLGPDNILGTDIGEVFNKDGSRKTNIELFLDLGWHIEETTGDKVYEWFDKNITFYTYRITAKTSNKYYYGVSHIRKPIEKASSDDCLNDGYYGSGGKHNKNNKFVNWKQKHFKNLQKEVLQLFSTKSSAYQAEKELVGELWKTDSNCLNSIEGGRYTGIHTGNSKRIAFKNCVIHGKTKHIGKTCCKCNSLKSISVKICDLHGATKFTGDQCRKCLNDNLIKIRECSIHGLVKHISQSCYKCSPAAFGSLNEKTCEIHGKTTFIKSKCRKCIYDETIAYKKCTIHGLSKHRNNTCYTCISNNTISFKNCSIHGLTKHAGKTCCRCTAEKSINTKKCEIHGNTRHIGNQCRKCLNEKNITMKNCSNHGLTKHVGNKCYKCRNTKYTLDNCKVHGETYFVNSECLKCRENIVEIQECLIHGTTKHMNGKCSKCRAEGSINIRECLIHGETKHKGKSCSKCTADKAAHRYHDESKGKTNKNCSICQKEIKEGSRKPLFEKKALINVCQLCRKEFEAKNKNQLFCSNPHDWNCVICNTEIKPVPRKGKDLYSCFKCRRELAELKQKTSHQKP